MPDQKNREQAGSQTNRGREPAEQSPVNSPPHDKKAKKRRSNSRDKYWPTPQVTRRITLIIEAGLLCVGVVYSFFTFQQWQAMREQIHIAKTQIQTSENDRRAWIVPVYMKLEKALAVDEPPEVTIQAKNSGQTLAYDAQSEGRIFTSLGEAPKKEMMPVSEHEPGRESKIIVAPDGGMITTYGAPFEMNQGMLDEIRSGNVFLYSTGRITYRDAFNKIHHTTFCYWITGKDIDKLNMRACGAGNSAD